MMLSCVGQKDDPERETGPDYVIDEPSLVPGESGLFFRRSLILDFTGTWCVHCPKMEAAIEEVLSRRPGRIIPVSVHCFSSDPMALMPFSQNLAKRFGVTAYPSAVIDMDPSTLTNMSSAELLLSQLSNLWAIRVKVSGICVHSSVVDGKLKADIEATVVCDGDYSLHLLVLEDRIVAAQTGGSENHIHDNVLRGWYDSDIYPGIRKGEKIGWETSVEATPGQRIVAIVCRNDLVDNVTECPYGEDVPYHYE